MRKSLTALSLLLLSGFSSIAQHMTEYVIGPQDVLNGYVIQKVWLENYDTPKVKLLQPRYTEVQEVPEGVSLKPATEFNIVLGKERKRPFALIRIPAYNTVEVTKQNGVLNSFTLQIEETPLPSTKMPKAKTTANASVLASGDWYKIAVAEKGMYKIDFDFIQSKLGVNPGELDPLKIRLYGNGGQVLSESNAVPRPEDLVENQIVVVDGGDNRFDPGDHILFYASGPTAWVKDSARRSFIHVKNIYEDSSFYFLNFDLGQGQRVPSQAGNLIGNEIVTSYNDYWLHHNDLAKVGNYGKLWWGEEFSNEPGKHSTRTFNFDLGNSTDSLNIRYHVPSTSVSYPNQFSVNLNGLPIGNHTMNAIKDDAESNPVSNFLASIRVPSPGNAAALEFTYTSSAANGRGYLDFIEINGRQSLTSRSGQFTFRDWNSVGPGKIATYKISNANSNLVVWDVTDPLAPVRMNGSFSGSEYSFTQDASTLHEFIAFDGSDFHTPVFVEEVENQNLHGEAQADYLIVTHKNFLDAANKLADFHRQKNQLRVLVTTTEKVYNEFSSGSQDIAAIRDFAKMFYDRAGTDSSEMPRYLLLFGDASYDYKDRVPNNTNFVPTYETSESVVALVSYCSEDGFGFLDDNEEIENWGIANTLDLGVGRLPVTTATSAMKIVDKIINYQSPASLGPWRLSTTIVTDDSDNHVHFEDGEIMASIITNNIYNPTKVHLAAIPKISTPGGLRAPNANKAINDAVFKGTFFMNYNGHGSISTLAHERILTQDDFNSWKNINKLPIVITATCEFSKYDEPTAPSAGERLILKEDGGAIALLTTTQLVYQHLNRPMNMAYISTQFRKFDGRWPTFGDAFRYSKNLTYADTGDQFSLANFRKFALLGDPAITPAFPEHEIVTDEIVDGSTAQVSDTISALGKHQISGSVRDINGSVITDFNGTVYVTIYDKPRTQMTLDPNPRAFKVRNNIIYKGKATVSNGRFTIVFVAPKDLNYEHGVGKISYYAENGVTDAAGVDTTVTIGGFSDNPEIENDPPIVRPFMNDSLFLDGGITGSNTMLYVQLSDETGINVSGNSIGHDLTAILDDQVHQPYILNDYYETAPNDYTRGYVYFPVTGLADGRHSLRVKAWDMNNNSGEGIVNFEVVNGSVVRILNLMNYPNPFRDNTRFIFEHNHPGEELSVQIYIFSTSGALVRTIKEDFTPSGSRSNEIQWDGTDNNGAKLPSGLYVYRLHATNGRGIKTTAYQKLVLIP